MIATGEDVFISPFILQEFHQKCIKKLGFSLTETETFTRLLKKRLQILAPDASSLENLGSPALRDPQDQPILELAAAVRADFLMTWDKDLLVLRHLKQTRILTPREFWDILGENQP